MFKAYKREVEMCEQLVEVEFTITVDEDDISIDDDIDGNPADATEYKARFERGELFIGVITVTAKALGVSGTDVLGGCHLHANNAFNSIPFNSDVEQTLSDHGMEQSALDELMTNIREFANKLRPFAD